MNEISGVDAIYETLRGKSALNKKVMTETQQAFALLRECSEKTALKLREIIVSKKDELEAKVDDGGEHNFSVEIGPDVIAFTNVHDVSAPSADMACLKSDYVREDPSRAYFGQILVYNFLTTSYLQRKMDEPGYMVARILVNKDGRFTVEGVGKMAEAFSDLASNTVSKETMQKVVESCILAALAIDLMMPPADQIQIISLEAQFASKVTKEMEKVGFRVSARARHTPS